MKIFIHHIKFQIRVFECPKTNCQFVDLLFNYGTQKTFFSAVSPNIDFTISLQAGSIKFSAYSECIFLTINSATLSDIFVSFSNCFDCFIFDDNKRLK